MAGVVKRKSHNEGKKSDDKMSHVESNRTISHVSIGGDAVIYMNNTNNGKLHSLSK